MSRGWIAFTIWCIAGSSVGAPAPFRARTAGRAVPLRKALALPIRSRRAAACASCASATASATRPRTVASSPWPWPCSWPWRVPAHPLVGVAWYCRLCKGRRQVGVRARTRATGAQRMWGPAGASGSTEGQRPRGPRVRVRGRVPPRCAGAGPPPQCACAGLREVRARGTRPPGRTARSCWRLSTLRRTPCQIPRRAGRCVGGGRAATKGRDGGARGRPISVRGRPGSPAGGRGRGAGSPCRESSAGPPATCRRGESRGPRRRG